MRHRTIGRDHRDFVARDKAPGTDEALDLVLLEQAVDAAGQGLHDRVLARQHLGHIGLHLGERDAVAIEAVFGLVIQLARLEQRLGRNAAHAQACATETVFLLDARHRQTKLSGADRSDVAAGTGADDDQIKRGAAHRKCAVEVCVRLRSRSACASGSRCIP